MAAEQDQACGPDVVEVGDHVEYGDHDECGDCQSERRLGGEDVVGCRRGIAAGDEPFDRAEVGQPGQYGDQQNPDTGHYGRFAQVRPRRPTNDSGHDSLSAKALQR
jgi:hypothetical protein